MKKGCVYIFFLLIFLTGVGYYIWQKYGEEIKEKTKNRIVKIAFENLNKKLVGINPEINVDSLVNSISDKILEKAKNIELDDINEYTEEIINRISEKLDNTEIKSPDLAGIEKLIEDYER